MQSSNWKVRERRMRGMVHGCGIGFYIEDRCSNMGLGGIVDSLETSQSQRCWGWTNSRNKGPISPSPKQSEAAPGLHGSLTENTQKKKRRTKRSEEREERMAKRNLGFLMRQLLGNSNNPGAGVGLLLHRRMRVVSNCTQTQPQPQTLPQALPCSSIIRSYSLHSLQHRRKPNIFESEPDSDSESLPKKRGKKDSNSAPPLPPPLPPFSSWYWQPPTEPPPPYPPNTVLYNSKFGYEKALKKIRDERLPSVLFFTVCGCKKTSKGIHPFFPELCEQFKHITIYVFPLECGMIFSMQFLGLKSPTFQFYLNGEKVEEISTGSIKRVIKTFENVYSPSGMKKRRRRQGPKEVKNEEEVDPSKLSKVLPNRFPASAYPKVMEAVESLPEANPLSELWWFAKGLFTSDEKRERFCELEDDQAKLEWLHCEMAE